MRFFRLRVDRNALFTRYARDEEGNRVKSLQFSPGVVTAVQDDDVEAIADDIRDECLTEITDEAEIAKKPAAYANPADVPQPVEAAHAATDEPVDELAGGRPDEGAAVPGDNEPLKQQAKKKHHHKKRTDDEN